VTAVAAGSLGPARTGRRPEALMLALGLLVDLAAYVAVGVGHDKSFPPSIGAYAGGFAALYLAAHLAVRRLAPYADPLLLPLVAFLNGLGLVLIHRLDLAGADRARQAGRPAPHGDAHVQFIWMLLGLALFVVLLGVVRDHRTLQRYTYTAMAGGIALLLVPAVLPASYSQVNGAKIWIRLAGLSFQPSEVAKILLIVFFAGYFVAKRDVLSLASRRFFGLNLPRGRDLGPVLVAWLLMLAVLIFERDLGTSLLFFGIFTAMLYVATERTSWLVIGIVLFCVGSYTAYRLFSHVHERVDIWLHPWSQSQGHAYQLVQGLFGLGTGGVLGTGLGLGRPDLVPFAKTDFITATLGEELGLAGLMAVLVVYGLVVQRGLRTAVSVRDTFGKLLVTGLAFSLALQVFVVVGGVTRLIPLTGMTLPFISYGGSSLVANWVIVALMMRVSDAARRPVQQAAVRAPANDETQVIPT
jgi:cell division protein FtsW (lipid II flippase)